MPWAAAGRSYILALDVAGVQASRGGAMMVLRIGAVGRTLLALLIADFGEVWWGDFPGCAGVGKRI